MWRRLLVRSDCTIAMLHTILQVAFGWSDEHLHQFLIRGKPYGIGRIGGIIFDDNPRQVLLRDFHFRPKETFVYEYDLRDLWQHEIRLEQVLLFDPAKQYPICIGSKRRGPLEDCGGPWVFMELQDERPQWKAVPKFAQLLLDHQDDLEDHEEEFRHLAYWVAYETFHPQTVNRRLAEEATRRREEEGISHAYQGPGPH
ncbi:MAG TPA: plasmid pRiA4b ORF-3 family protein [Ktedonobacteraceae bacterium]|nr:plasmid pRiA4b ORF-3 family protein [Ktedonobacteraceae bacterium]